MFCIRETNYIRTGHNLTANRVLFDARGDYRSDFMNEILRKSNGELALGLHLGYKDADFDSRSILRMEIGQGRKGHLLDYDFHTGNSLQLISSPEYGRILETAVEQMYRTSSDYSYRSHNIRHIQDYLDYFHIIADMIARRIVDSRITHAVFFSVPHLFFDTVTYEVCRALGIPMTILTWSQFEGRFFSMRNVQNLGRFNPSATDAPLYEIERGTVPDLFYMDDRWQREGETGRMNPRVILRFVSHLIRHDPLSLLRPVSTANKLRRVSKIYRSLPDWRDPFAKFFHTHQLEYFETLAKFDEVQPTFDKKYIYVPLHNQPEMSTSALGGIYRDQALMIETLARDLPEDWEIIVKENPRQNAYARGPMFFHRLKRIGSVKIVPTNTSTTMLTAKSQFVATVTGTVGWEAIRLGRPAVVFGAAWYGSFPGVVRYNQGLNFKEVAELEVDHESLQKAAGALLARSHKGVIERSLFKHVKSLDLAENTSTVAETCLNLILNKIEPTFS